MTDDSGGYGGPGDIADSEGNTSLGLTPKESAYYKCIRDNAYQRVSPGEVCTIDVAKKMGVWDAEKYFSKKGFETVRTFTGKDDSENRTDQVCVENTMNGKDAYPLCPLTHGFGFVRKMPGTCIAFDCPPGFEKEGENCVKPKVNAEMPLQSRCDEAWHDWYTVANYHLGNGYVHFDAPPETKKGGAGGANTARGSKKAKRGSSLKCFSPCRAYSVPYNTTDPVDQAGLDFTSQSKIHKCVSRADFFAGKYAEGSDYCPIAWIHRVGMTPSLVQKKLTKIYDAAEKGGGIPNEQMAALRANITNDAKAVAKLSGNKLEGLGPLTEEMQRACGTLNTKERLRDAYAICQTVQQDPDELTRRFYEDLGDNETMQ